MKTAERKALLQHFAELRSDTESSPPAVKTFLPVAAHARALQREVVVVLGVKGAGKSALFRFATESPKDVTAMYGAEVPHATWLDGYSEKIPHPQAVALMDLVAADEGNDELLRSFWLVYLVNRLAENRQVAALVPAELQALWGNPDASPVAWAQGAASKSWQLTSALDRIEGFLAERKSLTFVAYDALDKLGDLQLAMRARFVRSLLALWLSLSNRYHWLRPKIFLRHDLFEAAQRSFPDATKLVARSQSLDWSVDDLFTLVARHLANNAGPAVQQARVWLKGVVRCELDAKGDLGFMPGRFDEDLRRHFGAALAGEVMGSGVKKGYTYRWIAARLQDADRRIVPRSLLRLLSFAAAAALGNVLAKGDALMRPTDLSGALARTSLDRGAELAEEVPLVSRLQRLEGLTLLLPRREVEVRLAKRAGPTDTFVEDGAAAIEELQRLGVLAIRPDGRVDVPDIYRYGYKIKRKGGVRKPR